eukprot:jgi/Tetstr1/456857/TSEL_043529.t1
MPGLLRTWSGTADRASAAVHALLLRSPYEYSTLDTLVISGAVRLLVTVFNLPLLADKTREEVREELRVSWALWAAGTLLLMTRNATRRTREQSRQAVARRAALVDRQLTVTANMEFSSAEYQAAFERWPGHSSMDVFPLVLALVAHLAITGQLLQRQDVCTPACVLSMAPFGLAHVVRLVAWRRLSPAQRSWLNLAIVSAVCQACAGPMIFFHLASPLRVEDPQLRSAAACQQLAALSAWALLLWMLILTVRAAFAEHTMLRFLGSLRQD